MASPVGSTVATAVLLLIQPSAGPVLRWGSPVFLLTLNAFVASLILSWIGTWLVRREANRRGWVKWPASDRHIHDEPIPRLGGIAIFIATTITLAAGVLWQHRLPGWQQVGLQRFAGLMIPAALIFLLGLYDDIKGAGASLKFSVQAIAATLVFASGLRIVEIPILFGSSQFSAVISYGMTVLWILWITNAFNLIDGLDGLAAGSALFSTVAVLIVSAFNGNIFTVLVTAILSGALLGFLRFNISPATIFLGDCGSMLVGFMLATLALYGQKSPTIVAVAIPIVSFGLPMLETALSIVRRFVSGKRIFEADRDHIHHKLLKRGMSPRKAMLILYAVSAVFGLLSLLLLLPGGGPVALVLIVVGGILWLGVQHLGYPELVELGRVAQRTIAQKQIIVNNLAIRRAIGLLGGVTAFSQLTALLEFTFEENDFDGFELSFHSAVQAFGDYRHAWARNQAGRNDRWTLELGLNDNEGGEGKLLIYRRYSTEPLRVDINVVTHLLPAALSRAMLAIARADVMERAANPAAATVTTIPLNIRRSATGTS